MMASHSCDLDDFVFRVDGSSIDSIAEDEGGGDPVEEWTRLGIRTSKKAHLRKRVRPLRNRTSRKRQVSDDDDRAGREKKKFKARRGKASNEHAKIDRSSLRTIEDLDSIIDGAEREERIDEKKATRLRQCLRAGDWSQVACQLLCEQIPLKRNGKGYNCRICLVPKKGHNCPYCQVCSTADKKSKKDDHVCFICVACFEHGKRNKKLVQIKSDGHECPHEHG